MPTITFRPMGSADIPLYRMWAEKEHVKSVWFCGAYQPVEAILTIVAGNGYDAPYIIEVDGKAVGYVVSCDLYAYKRLCAEPCGLFVNEPEGTYCMDLFIGEEAYVDKGIGTQVVRQFSDALLEKGKRVLIDPSVENRRAIRCYEKAGFRAVREAHDGTARCLIMEKLNNVAS